VDGKNAGSSGTLVVKVRKIRSPDSVPDRETKQKLLSIRKQKVIVARSFDEY
jgi:hypothetical protein